jgi:hypothetical protein
MFDSRHDETCQVFHISGMGSATVWADRELDASISGAGEFKGGDLHSQTAETHISGMDTATVCVDRELDASIIGADEFKGGDLHSQPAETHLSALTLLQL